MHRAPSTDRFAGPDLIRIRPRPTTSYVSRGRCVMATGIDGTIDGHPDHGFFVHETRVLSRWRYTIDGEAPWPNASCVRQDRWLGYFVAAAPGVPLRELATGSGQVPAASQNTLELRVTRTVDDALHEDIALTNYTSHETSFTFAIELDADFADQAETRERQQFGPIATHRDADALILEYTSGTLRRSVTIRPATLRFPITLAPPSKPGAPASRSPQT